VKIGITSRLFSVILCATGLSMLCLILIMWWNVNRNMRADFLLMDQELHDRMVYHLAKKYEESGNWDFLKCFIIVPHMISSLPPPQFKPRDDPSSWFERIMNRIGGGRPLSPPKDVPLFKSPLIVLDADQKLLFGSRRPDDKVYYKPIIVRNKVVGYAGREPPMQFLLPVQAEVLSRQKLGMLLSAAGMLFVVVLISLPLARSFVKPIKQMALATHDIASGRYATRLPVSSSDEIGQLARDFNAMAQTLEKHQVEHRQLFADISHELRTPIAVFRAEIEAHLDGIQTITPESVCSLHAKTLRLEQLIGDIHQLSLSDLDAIAYRKEYLDPLDVLKESRESFRSEFDHKHIALLLDLPGYPKATVFGDRKRLDQLFINLLENSLRYTDDGGELRVRARTTGDLLTIEFLDSKPGVDTQDRERLFDRFYRVEKSRNVESGGTGLGLTICKKIVQAHDGTISAHESPLGGLLVRIRLPVTRGHHE
jgi:two-component system, OmpR family, sensor histidine kinase BaeS